METPSLFQGPSPLRRFPLAVPSIVDRYYVNYMMHCAIARVPGAEKMRKSDTFTQSNPPLSTDLLLPGGSIHEKEAVFAQCWMSWPGSGRHPRPTIHNAPANHVREVSTRWLSQRSPDLASLSRVADDAKNRARRWLSVRVIRDVVGDATFQRGQRYASPDRVTLLGSDSLLVAQVWGTAEEPYDVAVTFDDAGRSFVGRCTCPMSFNCKHVTAALLLFLRDDSSVPTGRVAEWERLLHPIVSRASNTRASHEVALLFNLKFVSEAPRLTIRPVVRSPKGKWVKATVTWQTFAYPGAHWPDIDPLTHHLLREILLVYRASSSFSYYGPAPTELRIDDISSSRLWPCLADLHRHGVSFIDATRQHAPVKLFTTPTVATLDISDDGKSLHVTPLVVTGESLGPSTFIFVGQPAHGVAVWTPPEGTDDPLDLRLGPLDRPLSAEVQRLFDGVGHLEIPPSDRLRFVREIWPVLQHTLPVSSRDGTFVAPSTEVTLRLTCSGLAADTVFLRWSWRYQTGDDVEELPLGTDQGAGGRDPAEERRLLGALYDLSDSLLEVSLAGPSRHLAPTQVITGMSAVRFVDRDLPQLRKLDFLEVLIEEPLTNYVESLQTPRLSVAGTTSPDWFDLDIAVSVGDEAVVLRELFVALARNERHLLLPSGTYFSLDRPEFAQLRSLIDEAHVSAPSESGALRINRYQVSWWNDLEHIAVLSDEAAQWSRSVSALRDVTGVASLEVPSSVRAFLRPYQHQGFEWMSFLRAHGLGGVLADDMGLGKTLQSIAVIARARELDPRAAPFLVVAPTSVVHNWVAECRRFCPELETVLVAATSARVDGTALASLHRGAAVVVTSYALFRLDFAAYEALDWSGLILDEAQFIKNHQSKSYACARQLSAPFKLALTGTPLENNLMELWSLLSVVAPGLLPDARRFTSYYRTPIEKHGDQARLEQLRRRIRPLLLRRTKGEVAVDLPEKIEHVIELELNPRHRRLYDTQLQRERKKVLGLLDDVQKNRFKIFASLTLLRQLSIDPSLVGEQYLKIPSTKLDALMEQIDEVISGGHRVLVFSQFTRFLARVRQRLDVEDVDYCYLDGSTRRRAQVIEEFKRGSAPVFLISLKAGGVGLNLTEADYCIVLDPWWNPATERQAVDRTHRIGQDRTVVVVRFVAKDTIEEKVMAMKERKAALFANVLEGTFDRTGLITADDIRSLLS